MTPSASALRTLGLVAMLLAVTAVWGWTFLIVKDAVASYPVLAFLAWRFVLASILLAPFVVRGFSWRTLGMGSSIGVVVAAGYLFQTAGLTETSAANAGLLTGLYVIFTPILEWALYRVQIARVTALAILCGFAGTWLLTVTSGKGFNLGDLLEVMTAVAFAVQIVWLGQYAGGLSSMGIAMGQMAPAALLFSFLAGASGQAGLFWPTPTVWVAIAVTGALASALAFWVQTFVQQRIPPSRVAIILLGEPAFAAFFAVWLGGERLSAAQWLGAVLILLSLLAHEYWILRTSLPFASPAR